MRGFVLTQAPSGGGERVLNTELTRPFLNNMNELQGTLFTNFTTEDFEHSWDRRPYQVKAGESVMFPDWLAHHLAKHLIDRELNKMDKPTNTMHLRKQMEEKIFGAHIKAESSVELETKIMNLNEEKKEEIKPWCDLCDSKGVRHKKECPKNKPEAEEKFAGLQ